MRFIHFHSAFTNLSNRKTPHKIVAFAERKKLQFIIVSVQPDAKHKSIKLYCQMSRARVAILLKFVVSNF